jgi:hypothetical protein
MCVRHLKSDQRQESHLIALGEVYRGIADITEGGEFGWRVLWIGKNGRVSQPPAHLSHTWPFMTMGGCQSRKAVSFWFWARWRYQQNHAAANFET